jgi:mRNA interferase RelE/StbE
MYGIEFLPDARKALRMMPRNVRELILAKIETLVLAPFDASNVRKLRGRDGWRLRVGTWRIIYAVDPTRLTIVVLTIATRGRVYQ